MPFQLLLKAPLDDLDPSAVIIEMIAMLFFDIVTGQGENYLQMRTR